MDPIVRYSRPISFDLMPEVPPQESSDLWFNSFLLKREVELDHLDELTPAELDRIICETRITREDPETKRGKWLLCGYFHEKAMLIRNDRKEAQ
jgi:hypothetical protein